jgi:hypothetical protein
MPTDISKLSRGIRMNGSTSPQKDDNVMKWYGGRRRERNELRLDTLRNNMETLVGKTAENPPY